MKRFQVEKTQSGYLAKKRKRPITQQQYYDQGVPRNVLMPPRTLLAQNILDSHGSSFFDTFSYLNFMKDYFKQNQITKPSFTDPNSLWGKITKWHRERKEKKAKEEEEEWNEAEKTHNRLKELRKEIDDLLERGLRNELDKEKLTKLHEEERTLEREDTVIDDDTEETKGRTIGDLLREEEKKFNRPVRKQKNLKSILEFVLKYPPVFADKERAQLWSEHLEPELQRQLILGNTPSYLAWHDDKKGETEVISFADMMDPEKELDGRTKYLTYTIRHNETPEERENPYEIAAYREEGYPEYTLDEVKKQGRRIRDTIAERKTGKR